MQNLFNRPTNLLPGKTNTAKDGVPMRIYGGEARDNFMENGQQPSTQE